MPAEQPPAPAPSALAASYGNLPMSFVANQGQSDEAVKFLARGQHYSVFLTLDEAVLSLHHAEPTPDGGRAAVVRMRLSGANAHPHLVGLNMLRGKSNYLIGADASRWQRDVPNYARVKYSEVYDGIDVVYYGNQRQLEFDFVVAPNADPSRIALAYDGVQTLSVDPHGNLTLETSNGTLTQHKPVIYQDVGGRREPVDGRYMLRGDNQVGFDIAGYDTTRPLVIDPVLSYSTYLGGAGNDIGHAIAVDNEGNAYVTGRTLSNNFPIAGPIQSARVNSYDAFVTKFSPAGAALIYSTYLGGSGGDYGYGIAVDSTRSAYVTGETDSPTVAGAGNVPFPTVGAFQPGYRGGGDAFVAKLNSSGNALVYSTYLGGSGVERGYGIAVDASDNAYVTGHTNSVNGPGNFPVVGAFQPQNGSIGNFDAFVTKFNASGNGLLYSTYLGGNGSEYSLDGGAIAVDSDGNAYVGGTTGSSNFPGASTSSIQSSNGGGVSDGFVVKVNAAGSGLVYSTYLGGNAYDAVHGLAIHSSGDAFVAGYSDSASFPTTAGALQSSKPAAGNDAFVSRLNASGTALVYSTYLGGSGGDVAYDMAVDGGGNAYIAGWTTSTNFPTAAPLQSLNSGSGGDAFVSVLNGAGQALVFSTYLGGNVGSEHGYGIDVDSGGNAYVTGRTNSTNFPTAAPLQATFGGSGEDAFVARITGITAPPNPTQPLPPSNFMVSSVVGNTVTVAWLAPPAGGATPTGYVLEGGVTPGSVLASLPTGSTATTFTFSAPTGSYYIRLHSVASGIRSSASNEVRLLVNVAPPSSAPSAPAGLAAAVSGNSLTLSWMNTSGGGVPTEIILDVTGAFTGSLSVPLSESFSIASVPNGTYTISLRAFNAAGSSGSSNSVTFTVPSGCSVPETPTNFQLTRNGGLITAVWDLPSSGPAPTGYRVIVAGAFNGELSVTARSISGAVGTGSYTLSVMATNACGSGPATAPQTVTVP